MFQLGQDDADLAIIKIATPATLPVMPVGTSSDLLMIEEVWAVGNAYRLEAFRHQGDHQFDRSRCRTERRAVLQEPDSDRRRDQSRQQRGPARQCGRRCDRHQRCHPAGSQKIGFAIPIDDARDRDRPTDEPEEPGRVPRHVDNRSQDEEPIGS